MRQSWSQVAVPLRCSEEHVGVLGLVSDGSDVHGHPVRSGVVDPHRLPVDDAVTLDDAPNRFVVTLLPDLHDQSDGLDDEENGHEDESVNHELTPFESSNRIETHWGMNRHDLSVV